MIFTDQLKREIELPNVPQRIVSLVPSQTELLHYLGLGERVLGITKFCIHPRDWYKSKNRVGGTKDFNIKKIRELQPDLIIGNKEENTQEGLEELSGEFPVWISDVKNLADALAMIRGLGLVLDKIDEAEELVSLIARKKRGLGFGEARKCVYLIWRDPYMTVGGDTYINNMLSHAGFENVFSRSKRYPSIALEEIKRSEAEFILLSSEPFPFKERHLEEIRGLTGKKVFLVDGEAFSWYGSRILESWEYFRKFAGQIVK